MSSSAGAKLPWELIVKIIQAIDENIELLVGIRVVDEEHYGIMLEDCTGQSKTV